MKIVLMTLICLTSLFSLDISNAVELGLAKKNQYMDTDQKLNSVHLADDKLDIRLVYIKFLEDRQNMNITNGAIKKLEKLKDAKSVVSKFAQKQTKMLKSFEETKALLESIIDKKIEDMQSIENIKFSQLKNDSLESLIDKSTENSGQISSLERELNEHDSKKSDSSWNVDVSGGVMYGYETARGNNGRRYSGNEVEVGVSIVLSKNSGYENDSTIDIAKKRYDLEQEKTRLSGDIKKYRDDYIKALKEYKIQNLKSQKYNLKKLKDTKELEGAYSAYMLKTEARYSAYRKYARLLHIIERN